MATSKMNKTELIDDLNQSFDRLFKWCDQQSQEKFDAIVEEGKWNASQHLDHLIKSTKPLNKALGLPKLVLKGMFGKCNREEKTYEGVVQKYQSALANGGVAGGDFVPPLEGLAKKEELIKFLEKERSRLIKLVGKWKEEDLSSYVLPHPLIGKLSVREMLNFTSYHTLHHTKILEERH